MYVHFNFFCYLHTEFDLDELVKQTRDSKKEEKRCQNSSPSPVSGTQMKGSPAPSGRNGRSKPHHLQSNAESEDGEQCSQGVADSAYLQTATEQYLKLKKERTKMMNPNKQRDSRLVSFEHNMLPSKIKKMSTSLKSSTSLKRNSSCAPTPTRPGKASEVPSAPSRPPERERGKQERKSNPSTILEGSSSPSNNPQEAVLAAGKGKARPSVGKSSPGTGRSVLDQGKKGGKEEGTWKEKALLLREKREKSSQQQLGSSPKLQHQVK